VLKDYSFDFSLFFTRHPIAKSLLHIKVLSVEPVFSFFLRFSTMNMNRLICLVSIEKESPAAN
jgi:hypothetical protein